MRWLYLSFMIAIGHVVFGQEKEVVVTKGGVTTNANKNDLPNLQLITFKTGADSLSDKVIDKFDTIRQIKQFGEGQRVFSEQKWRLFRDSLKRIPSINLPDTGLFSSKKVSDKELVNRINAKFFGSGADSLSNYSRPKDVGGKVGDLDKLKSLDAIDPKEFDLANLKLSDDQLKGMKILPGNTIKTRYLKYLDSLQKISLNEQKLKLDKRIYEDRKLFLLKEKLSFWDKSYKGILFCLQ
jgi:hypothetical protein